MDLFEHASSQNLAHRPLADRLRPHSLDEVIGHEDALGPQTSLGQLLRAGQLPNLIFWGSPGTGKTTLAMILVKQVNAHGIILNAVDSGAKALREAGEEGRQRRLLEGRKTVLFVDEIHRFNKAQQDVLLPYIEKGDLILLGATTENPSYELNRALLSRCRVVVLRPLDHSQLAEILKRAIQSERKDLSIELLFTPQAQDEMIRQADGDARRLLNALEIVFGSWRVGSAPLLPKDLVEMLQFRPLAYDKNSEMHYDIISAFIKSIRGSDADAGLYYLARMLEGGEDPLFIARRLIILASEDVGNADPRALTVAVSGLQALEAIGLPEGAIVLAQVVTYLASAPKSNRSYMGLGAAKDLVQKTGSLPVPRSLRSARTDLAKQLGYGDGYKYPHDFPGAWVEQKYLPEEIQGVKLYEPSSWGFEKQIREYQDWLRRKRSSVD